MSLSHSVNKMSNVFGAFVDRLYEVIFERSLKYSFSFTFRLSSRESRDLFHGDFQLSQELSFREIRYVEKRKKILKQAAKIFAKKGYEKASLEEIATRLKLSKASLYHYIESKDEVLYLIQMEAIEQVLISIRQIQKTDKTPPDKLEDIIRIYVAIVTQNQVIGALSQQELILPKKWRNKIIALRDKCDQGIQDVISQGLKNGHFKVVDGKMAYMAAIGALNGILKWYNPKGKLSVSEISDAMVDFILKGFGANRKNPD